MREAVQAANAEIACVDGLLVRRSLPAAIRQIEIDHLIPLCLGGADDPSNLWPQPRRS